MPDTEIDCVTMRLPEKLSRQQSLAEAIPIVLRRLAGQLQRAAAELAGKPGAARLHAFRTSVRRLRSMLQLFRDALPGDALDEVLVALDALTARTSPLRTLDVLMAQLEKITDDWNDAESKAAQTALTVLVDHTEARQQALLDEVSGPGFGQLLEKVEALAASAGAGGGSRAALGRQVAVRVRRLAKLLIGRGRRLVRRPDVEELHRLRLLAKRLRYLIEAFRPILHPRAVRRVLRVLSDFQDNLGRIQDAESQLRLLIRMVSEQGVQVGADELRILGRLEGLLAARRERALADFPRFFKAFNTARNRQALARLAR